MADRMIKILFLIAAGLVLPVLLIPVVKWTGYSLAVEEIFKAAAVFWLVLALSGKQRLWAGVMFGLLFGISESFLFFGQMWQGGALGIWGSRFLLTAPMHALTVLVMTLTAWKNRAWLPLGLGLALVIHWWFNSVAVNWIS